MSSSESTPTPASEDLTIAEAARALGTGRHLIRTKLQAGAFPNAAKDAQGFWRIPEADLVAAGLRADGAPEPSAPSPAAEVIAPATSPPISPDEGEELALLRIEVLDLRHRLERAEALLEAERRLSEERARALDTERATTEAVYRQFGITTPKSRQPEPTRPDWQASMRAARARDAELRAAREREAAKREPRREPVATRDVSTSAATAGAESATPTDVAAAERRPRWRRR